MKQFLPITFFLLLPLSGCFFRPPLSDAETSEIRQSLSQKKGNASDSLAQTHKVTAGSFKETIAFAGIVGPRELAQLRFAVPGRIAQCPVKEGDRVQRDQVICSLEDTVVKAELRRAQGAWAAAKRVSSTNITQKQQELFEAGVIGQGEFEQARVQSETVKAQESDAAIQWDLARTKYREHQLRAPFDAKIMKMIMTKSQLVSPEIPVAIVASEGQQEVKAKFDARYFFDLSAGVKGTVEEIAGKLLPLPVGVQVVQKDESIDPASQKFGVLLMPNDLLRWPPGAAILGHIEIESRGNLKIPADFVTEFTADPLLKDADAKGIVYVKGASSQSLRRLVTLGSQQDGWILVKKGLAVGETLIMPSLKSESSNKP